MVNKTHWAFQFTYYTNVSNPPIFITDLEARIEKHEKHNFEERKINKKNYRKSFSKHGKNRFIIFNELANTKNKTT